MKKIISLLSVFALLLTSAACSNAASPIEEGGNTSQSTEAASNSDNIENTDETTTTENKPTSGGSDYTSLKLINYLTDDSDGADLEFFANTEDWQQLDDYDLFREYFFGKWKISEDGPYMAYLEGIDSICIDDSEYSLSNYGMSPFGGFYRVSDNVLGFFIGMESGSHFYWMDTDNPDKMYVEYVGFDSKEGKLFIYTPGNDTEGYKTRYLTKTDEAPASSKDDSYVGIFKFYEMSKAYGIDIDMLLNIKLGYTAEDKQNWLFHDGGYNFYPVYLVSENDDKLVFETTVGNVMNDRQVLIPVTYTIEKKNGEWSRTVEIEDLGLIEAEY